MKNEEPKSYFVFYYCPFCESWCKIIRYEEGYEPQRGKPRRLSQNRFRQTMRLHRKREAITCADCRKKNARKETR